MRKTVCVLGALAALGSGWVQRVETKDATPLCIGVSL
jgi:hypothetical protein